jgi:hypothetical protein
VSKHTTPSVSFVFLNKFKNSAKEITSRSRLARTLHFARMRALVTSGVWKESPVTASNPKRLHFRFALNHDNFALLLQQQQKMQEKQQTAQQQTAQ